MNTPCIASLLAAAVACGVAIAPIAPPEVADAQTSSVSIQNYAFVPPDISIPAGTTVTWKNTDEAAHTVTSDTNAFGSDVLNTGQSYSFTFTSSGTFTYHCIIHPYMTAKIVVAASGPAPTSTPLPVQTTATPATIVSPPTSASTPTPIAATAIPTGTTTPVSTATATEPALVLHVSPATISHGEAVTIRVTVQRSGHRTGVKRASVSMQGKAAGIAGTRHARTDARGRATFKNVRAPHTGTITVSASRAGYRKATARIHVR